MHTKNQLFVKLINQQICYILSIYKLQNQKLLKNLHLQLMGNKSNCCQANSVQMRPDCQINADADTQIQQWQNQSGNRLNNFQKQHSKSLSSKGIEILNYLNYQTRNFDSISSQDQQSDTYLDENSPNEQLNSVLLYNKKIHTHVQDYIAFKKYSPKIHYKFIKMIYSSKTSKIYKVIHLNNNSEKAVKVIKPNKIKNSSSCFNKFSNIMSALHKLDHPNIIRFYEIYEHKGKQFIIMQLLEGGSLKDMTSCRRIHKNNGYISNTDSYFEEIKIITKQILYALRYLHDNQIAHLNIKPKNIMLINKFASKKQIFAKLIGFGSSMTNVTQKLRAVSNQFIKNKFDENQLLPYEIEQNKSVCLNTDIWMLGVAIFQTITKVKIHKNVLRRPNNEKDSLQVFVRNTWKKLQEQLYFCQNHCLDLILKMVADNPHQRLSSLQCLQHLWFVTLQFDQLKAHLKQSSKNAFEKTVIQKKSNNLISYIQNLIVYKNITQKQMATISEIFSILDKDKNGSVAIQELIQYLQQQLKIKKQSNSFEYCLEILNNIDNDGSGEIDYHQFSKALVNKKKHITQKAISQIFDHIDMDGDGKIILSELKTNLKSCDVNELEYYMRKIDKNFDQTITKAEFVNYCIIKFQEKWNDERMKNIYQLNDSIKEE